MLFFKVLHYQIKLSLNLSLNINVRHLPSYCRMFKKSMIDNKYNRI